MTFLGCQSPFNSNVLPFLPFANLKASPISYPERWLFGTVVCPPQFPCLTNKVTFLAQHLASPLTGLSCRELGLGYKVTLGIVPGYRGERGDMRVTGEGTDWVSRRERRGNGAGEDRRGQEGGKF